MIKPCLTENNSKKYLSPEELFTDREEPRKFFWDIYNSIEKGSSNVITYYGMGGIGKSWLLKRLCYELKEKNPKKMPNYAFCSFEGNVSKEEFLYSLSRQMMLCNKKICFPLFDAAFTKIAVADGKDLKSFEKKVRKSFEDNPLVDIAVNIGGQFLPGLEPATKIVKAICSFASGRKYKKELEKGPNSDLYKVVMASEGKEIRSKFIHDCFKFDVQAFLTEMEHPYVVFIDGYENYVSLLKNENYADDKDNWLRESLIKELPNVLWVISGREKLNWDEDILPSDYQHIVGDLSEKDTAEFFKKVNIVDEKLVRELYKLTNGTPAYLYLCSETYEKIVATRKPTINDFGKNASELVERFFENMSEGDKNIVIMLSFFPKVWDLHMAEVVAKELGYEGYIDNIYKLVKMSLFERVENGYKLHETFRNVVKCVHKDRQERIGIEIIQYLARVLLESRESMDYMHRCMQFAEVFELCEKKVVSDEDMQEILPAILKEVPITSSYTEGEYIFSTLEKVFEKCGYSFETVLECKNVRYANLIGMGRYGECFGLVNQIIEREEEYPSVDAFYLIKFYCVIGYAYRYMGEYIEAIGYMLEAQSLALNKWNENNKYVELIMSEIADLYREHEECTKVEDIHPESIESLYSIVSLYDGLHLSFKSKGIGENTLKTMIDRFGENNLTVAKILYRLAEICCDLGKYDEAKGYYERAYNIRRDKLGESSWETVKTLEKLAFSLWKIKEYEGAKHKYEQIYKVYESMYCEYDNYTIMALIMLSDTCCYIKKYDEAKGYFEKLYCFNCKMFGEEKTVTFYYLNELAYVHNQLEEYDSAISLYEPIFEKVKSVLDQECIIEALSNIAWAYHGKGNCEKAKEIFEELYAYIRSISKEKEYAKEVLKIIDGLDKEKKLNQSG